MKAFVLNPNLDFVWQLFPNGRTPRRSTEPGISVTSAVVPVSRIRTRGRERRRDRLRGTRRPDSSSALAALSTGECELAEQRASPGCDLSSGGAGVGSSLSRGRAASPL